MRWVCALVIMLAAVAGAEAQVAWLGVGSGVSWEYQPESNPDRNFYYRSRSAPAVFLALPVDDETLFRLRGAEIPYEVVVDGTVRTARLRGYTAGVDYFLGGIFGKAIFSAGVGGYRLEHTGAGGPDLADSTKFGWYVGLGEWFTLTERLKLTAELLGHRTGHPGRPTLVTATVGLAFSF